MICKKCRKVFYDCCSISPFCPDCAKNASKKELADAVKG